MLFLLHFLFWNLFHPTWSENIFTAIVPPSFFALAIQAGNVLEKLHFANGSGDDEDFDNDVDWDDDDGDDSDADDDDDDYRKDYRNDSEW